MKSNYRIRAVGTITIKERALCSVSKHGIAILMSPSYAVRSYITEVIYTTKPLQGIQNTTRNIFLNSGSVGLSVKFCLDVETTPLWFLVGGIIFRSIPIHPDFWSIEVRHLLVSIQAAWSDVKVNASKTYVTSFRNTSLLRTCLVGYLGGCLWYIQ